MSGRVALTAQQVSASRMARPVQDGEIMWLWSAVEKAGVIPMDPLAVARFKEQHQQDYLGRSPFGRYHRQIEPIGVLFTIVSFICCLASSGTVAFTGLRALFTLSAPTGIFYLALGLTVAWILAALVCSAVIQAAENYRTAHWATALAPNYEGAVPARVAFLMTEIVRHAPGRRVQFFVEYFRHDPFLRVTRGGWDHDESYYVAKW